MPASNPLGSYSFVVCKPSGENVGEATNAKARGLSMLLNGIHTAKLTLSLYDPIAGGILPGVSRLKVFRNPSADELVVNANQARALVFHGTLPESAIAEDGSAETLSMVFADPRFVLAQRYAQPSLTPGTLDNYFQVDQGSIGWGLVATQNARANGDTWIRQGGIATGIVRDRAYDARDVQSLLSELNGVIDGPDFDFDPLDGYALGLGQVQGNFRAYARQGTDRPNVAFGYGPGTLSNVRNMQRGYLQVVNRATVTGTTQSSGTIPGLPITGVNDASNASFGIRESFASYPDVSIQATVDSVARGTVSEQASPREVITITEPTSDAKTPRPFEHYYLGDGVRASCRKGSMVFSDRTLRLHGIDLDINDKGYAAVRLTAGV